MSMLCGSGIRVLLSFLGVCFNFIFILRQEFLTTKVDVEFYVHTLVFLIQINICGNISETMCPGTDNKLYGACVQKSGHTQGIAEAKTKLDFTEFGAMSMLYEGGRLSNG